MASPPILFKRIKHTVALPLSLIYNQFMSVAYVPDTWKMAVITPVYKKGAITDCCNYRPISVACVMSKIFERVVCREVHQHLSCNDILYPAQHGFLKGRSTCTDLLESLNDWTLSPQDRHGVVIVYIDFSKNLMWSHIRHYLPDYTPMAYRVTCYCGYAIFSQAELTTKVRNNLSEFLVLISGVVQGSVIGPLTFLMYINELISILERYGIIVKMFADDVKLYLRIINDVDVCMLERALTALAQWALDWQLTISVEKCCVLHLGNVNKSLKLSVNGSSHSQL